MLRARSFTFVSYRVDRRRSVIVNTYRVELAYGITKTFTDRLYLPNMAKACWDNVPKDTLESTLQALHIMLGINYWAAFPTRNIHMHGFTLTREQARFWNEIYLHGLGEFFYLMQIDFRDIIAFPYGESAAVSVLHTLDIHKPPRALLLNGAGKDSILSAELLRASSTHFDFFSFAPTPAHKKIAELVGSDNVTVTRKLDRFFELYMDTCGISRSYPSVSTFTFTAVLLAKLLGYDSIVFSNERSADIGNLTYLGLPINHQWCKSSDAEKMINNYIQQYITPHVSTYSLLRKYSELDIVKQFIQYKKYLSHVTSCNNYFWLPRWVQWLQQHILRRAFWCRRCPKCVFLFACYAAYMPKKDVVAMFGGNVYADKRNIPYIKRILGIEGFKPLDCVGEPGEMIVAMHLASRTGEYRDTPAMVVFEDHYPNTYDFASAEQQVYASS